MHSSKQQFYQEYKNLGPLTDLSRYSDAVAFLSPSASITMSICRSLSAWNGAPLSTWGWMDMLLRVRESACTRDWCWFTCAPDR